MRRISALVMAVIALAAFAVTPVQAQDLADLPRMGFAIESSQGFPGDIVEGSVDTDDVQEHCLDWVPAGEAPDEALVDYYLWEVAYPVLLGFPDPPLSGPGPGPYYFGEERLVDGTGDDIEDPVFQAFYRVWGTFQTGLHLDGTGELRELFFSSMFPMTFVDPVTQDLIGEIGGYDPYTGDGSVVVPDIDPSLYVVAAACTFPITAEEQVSGGLDRSFETFSLWVAENYPDHNFPEFELIGEDSAEWRAFAEEAAPVILQELVDIQAVGIEFYCILDPDGQCAPPTPGVVELIDELGDPNGNGLPGGDGTNGDESPSAADPVGAAPAFTG